MWIVDVVLSISEDLPNPAPKAPPGLDVAAETFLAWLKWGAMFAGVVGLITCGVMMMLP